MPDDLVPLSVAACRLAFGDDDFTAHLTPIGDTIEIAPGVVGAGTWGCPERDREMNRLIEFAKAGKLTILAWRYGDTAIRAGSLSPSPRNSGVGTTGSSLSTRPMRSANRTILSPNVAAPMGPNGAIRTSAGAMSNG
jgi:hypothetical protein